MNESQRVAWWQNLARRYPWLQQFGQSNSSASYNGKTGCGFTILQVLALGWLGKFYTHNQIAALVGYPNAAQRALASRGRIVGLYPSQITTFITKTKLPYAFVGLVPGTRTWTPNELRRAANTLGPVAFPVRYGDQPEWSGARYLGVVADGKPNGFASPLGKAGKTQLVGFEDGSHLDLLLGYHVIRDSAGAVKFRTHHVKDPNHGSVPRPERPPFDDISQVQFERLQASPAKLGRQRWALVPTRPFEA